MKNMKSMATEHCCVRASISRTCSWEDSGEHSSFYLVISFEINREHKNRESGNGRIRMVSADAGGMDPSIFELVLHWLYTGDSSIMESNGIDLVMQVLGVACRIGAAATGRGSGGRGLRPAQKDAVPAPDRGLSALYSALQSR